MNEDMYVIENLKCSYDGEDIVLYIERLNIPYGKIVFFVGRSGIGKSTILETLGFMNNTIYDSNDSSKFVYKGENVLNAWKFWNDEKMSAFKNNNFSFVFQQNNLMPNFSALQNVMITAMIQGKSYMEAEDEAQRIINMLWGIDAGEERKNEKDKPISEWSGGEKQRLAFARAILPKFSVIFGDEPTGNLDASTAERLMKVLVDSLSIKKNEEKDNNATAIIVSHDIKLAVDNADMIVFIQNKPVLNTISKRKFIGYINDESIYKKDNDVWYHLGQKIEKKECIYNELLDKLKK